MRIDDHVIFAAWLYAVRPEHVTAPMRSLAKIWRWRIFGRQLGVQRVEVHEQRGLRVVAPIRHV